MSLVVTGNPGVGKHTVAKSLSKILNIDVVDINKIALESGLCEKKGDSFEVDVSKLKRVLKKKLTPKSVVVGHLAPYVLDKTQVKTAIALRKSPYKLLSIYKKRRYSSKKIAENLGSEILGIIAYDAIQNFGKKKTHQIDTTSKSVSETIRKIQNGLQTKFEEEPIDWLGHLTEKNELKKFFSY